MGLHSRPSHPHPQRVVTPTQSPPKAPSCLQALPSAAPPIEDGAECAVHVTRIWWINHTHLSNASFVQDTVKMVTWFPRSYLLNLSSLGYSYSGLTLLNFLLLLPSESTSPSSTSNAFSLSFPFLSWIRSGTSGVPSREQNWSWRGPLWMQGHVTWTLKEGKQWTLVAHSLDASP